MARIPLIEQRNQVEPGGEAAFDLIAESRGKVAGPFAALLHSPELASRTARLGAYIRFESGLSGEIREVAILTVARQMDCRYEWAMHVPLARKAGVREEAIVAIRAHRAPAGLTDDEAQIVGYVNQLLASHRVDEETYRALEARLGLRALVELTATAGYYGMIACTLNAFDVMPGPADERLPV